MSEQVEFCTDCPLAEVVKQPVPGERADEDSSYASLMFIGEAPGREEDIKGRAFVGRAGRDVFKPALEHAQLERSDINLYNVLRCRPPNNKITSARAKEALQLCPSRYLFPDILKIKPKVLVTMGATATSVVFGRKVSIGDVRGRPIEVSIGDYTCIVLPTYHPASALRGRSPSNATYIQEDFVRAVELLDGYKTVKEKYFLLDTITEVDRFFDGLRAANVQKLTYDIEGKTYWEKGNDQKFVVDEQRDTTLGISLAWKTGRAAYLPIRHRPMFTVDIVPYWGKDQGYVMDRLKEVLEDPDIPKGGQNKKYDNQVLQVDLGIVVQGYDFDTMTASHIMNENQLSHSLAKQVEIFIPLKAGWKQQANYNDMSAMELEEIAEYCNTDADVERRLWGIHARRLGREPKLKKLYHDYVMPLQRTLQGMEYRGAPVDVAEAERVRVGLDREKRRLEIEMRKQFGRIVDVNSDKKVLFALREEGVDLDFLQEKDYHGDPVLDKNDNPIYRTDKTHLETIVDTSPLAKLVLDMRSITKLHSTYVLPILLKAIDGRIHGHYWPLTVTGRLMSSDPNLQNIPKGGSDEEKLRDVWGKRVKGIFVTADDRVFVQGDESQIEVRVFAYKAGDKELAMACAAEDVHLSTACFVKDWDYDEASRLYKLRDPKIKDGRDYSKSLTFLVLYGGSEEAAAQIFHLPVDKLKEFKEAYFERFSGADRYIKKVQRMIDKYKVVEDDFGWKRRIPYAGEKGMVGVAHRRAVNSLIQGMAARITNMALIRIDRILQEEGLVARPVLTVHDSIIVDCPEKEVDIVVEIMNAEMARKPLPKFNVPLNVDFEVGQRWSQLEEYDIAA